eukprot:13414942-Alexandrium_andersonii.AAC.1
MASTTRRPLGQPPPPLGDPPPPHEVDAVRAREQLARQQGVELVTQPPPPPPPGYAPGQPPPPLGDLPPPEEVDAVRALG